MTITYIILFPHEKKQFNKDMIFWNKIKLINFKNFENDIKVLLLEYGTTLCCNRFNIGNIIEFKLADEINNYYKVKDLSNEKRYDINIIKYEKISVKYSKIGNIKLINSLGLNKDVKLCKTLILTPNRMYLISIELLQCYGINSTKYIKNTKDGAILKRSLLTLLDKINYHFKLNLNISIKISQNKSLSRLLVELIDFKGLRKKYKLD